MLPQDVRMQSRQGLVSDEHGEFDFEALEALDLDLLNSQLVDLMTGGSEVTLPRFNFQISSLSSNGTYLFARSQ